MFSSKIIGRCLLPGAAVVVEAKSKSKENDNICRPSELPIYTPEVSKKSDAHLDETPAFLENSIRNVRETLEKVVNEVRAYEKVAVQGFNESKENLDWLITYLRKEDNTLPKAGAISIGALTGLIFGLRGGFFKRSLYATTGALGMAAVCYPKEASEYTQIGVAESKKYLTIAYNFAYGDNSEVKIEQVKGTESVSKVASLVKDPSTIVSQTHLLAMQTSNEHCEANVTEYDNSNPNTPP